MNHQDSKSPRTQTEPPAEIDALAKEVIDCAFKVHQTLGPGLLESVYENCMLHEIRKRSLLVENQIEVPVIYDGLQMDCGFRMDLLVEKKLLVELKAVESILPVHMAQVLTYLKLGKIKLGVLINFNVPLIKQGIKRIVL